MEAVATAKSTAGDVLAPPVVALRIDNLTKHFGGACVLDRVSLEVRRGEVHGLLGQNGSGKSTLIKILAGFHPPDPGARLEIGGRAVQLPLAAGDFMKLGIAFVHQHLGLIASMTVLENLLVGEHAARPHWRIDWTGQARRARDLFARFGLPLDPNAPVERLTSVERALLAIVRAFDQLENTKDTATKLLILDEPTPFLPADDVARLFALVRDIVAQGASVIFVSHDIDEISELTDRITVLRDGRVAGALVTQDARKSDIVELIVGRAVDLAAVRPPARPLGTEKLRISGLDGRILRDFGMTARAGEVIGLTGLMGSGYDEVMQLCFGAATARAGRLWLDGAETDLRRMTPHRAVQAGIVLVPGDRLAAAIVPTLSVTDNVTLPVLAQFGGGLWLDRQKMRRYAAARGEAFDVRPRDPDALMRALSGGNQQKVVLSKWFQIKPRLVLLDEPTQGVDVGARAQVFAAIRDVSAQGAAIVCASSDHEQLAAICDRVLVLNRGCVVASLSGEQISKPAIAAACYITAETMTETG